MRERHEGSTNVILRKHLLSELKLHKEEVHQFMNVRHPLKNKQHKYQIVATFDNQSLWRSAGTISIKGTASPSAMQRFLDFPETKVSIAKLVLFFLHR